MKKHVYLISVVLFFSSCVSQSEYDKVLSEKNTLATELERVKKEYDDLKYGAPNLLADGKKFFEAGSYNEAKEKFQLLLEKHASRPEAIEATKLLKIINEEMMWNLVQGSDDIANADSYLTAYPKGKYTKAVLQRKKELIALKMKNDYDAATTQNTSSAWKDFLNNYPNHPDAAAIRKKIIRLEVDEITSNSSTGEMPAFNQYNSGYSSSSVVEITNDTGCELTVRYSGPDAEIIVIPVGATRTAYLTSGEYKIAASACGENYAGTERLSGRYGSTFYIRTYRY